MSQRAMQAWIDAVVACLDQAGIRSILDVGCGTGAFSNLRRAFTCEVVGIDRSLSMLREAQHLTEPGIRLVQSDAERIPIRDGYFDLLLRTSAPSCQRVKNFWQQHPAAVLSYAITRLSTTYLLTQGKSIWTRSGNGPAPIFWLFQTRNFALGSKL